MEILEIDFQQPSVLLIKNNSSNIVTKSWVLIYASNVQSWKFVSRLMKYIDLKASDGCLNCDNTAWADGYLYQIKLIKTIRGIFLVWSAASWQLKRDFVG